MLICDVCGKTITDAAMAMVKFPHLGENAEVTSELTFCHKKTCDTQREGEGWWELRHFFARLLTSTGMNGPEYGRAVEASKISGSLPENSRLLHLLEERREEIVDAAGPCWFGLQGRLAGAHGV